MSEYIRTNKIDPNECPNKYSCPIYSNIRIFEYIRHTLFRNPDMIVGKMLGKNWNRCLMLGEFYAHFKGLDEGTEGEGEEEESNDEDHDREDEEGGEEDGHD